MSEKNRRDILKAGLIAGGSLALLNSCESFPDIEIAGISSRSVMRVGKAIVKASEQITPEQEYYIGRSVAANIYSRYRPYNDHSKTKYLNTLGLHLAQSSDLPETFGGYHFAILDSNEVNAFAAPGGFIFVTKGMLNCCQHEDALAAVLAHEIAHVQLQHGLNAIKNSRITDAVLVTGTEAASTLGGAELRKVATIFDDSVSDIMTNMIDNGFSRSDEYETDKLAVKIMGQAGYQNRGMSDMLTTMDKKLKPGGLDFFKTHPSPQNRLSELSASIDKSTIVPARRTQRFRVNIGQV